MYQHDVYGNQVATLIVSDGADADDRRLIAAGYETSRNQSHSLPEGERRDWNQRLLLVRSGTMRTKP